jgi:peptidoglycan-N-acetylglucosamine deacetylase
LRPIKPYYWQVGAQNKIMEIPVSTIPVIKLPFHLSYLLYLSGYSLNLMRLYLNSAIRLCKLTKTEPSFLLHPLDLIGGDQIPELAFFPGMNISSARKTFVFQEVIKTLSRHFQIINMSEYARRLSTRNNLRVVNITQ